LGNNRNLFARVEDRARVVLIDGDTNVGQRSRITRVKSEIILEFAFIWGTRIRTPHVFEVDCADGAIASKDAIKSRKVGIHDNHVVIVAAERVVSSVNPRTGLS